MSATNRGTVRNEYDFYPTPYKTLDVLLKEIDFDKINTFLEPCSGDKRILNRIQQLKTDMVCFDTEIQDGTDYLTTPFSDIDCIITNPPFSLAKSFLTKSLKEAKVVIYLLRLNYLGSQKRKVFWELNPPTNLYVLSERPSFTGHGTDATEYAWFIWDKLGVLKDNKTIKIL